MSLKKLLDFQTNWVRKASATSIRGVPLAEEKKGQLLLIWPPAAFWHPVALRWAVRSGFRMLALCIGNGADLVLENLVPTE